MAKKTFVKNWSHTSPEVKYTITVHQGGKIRKDIKPERISEIVENVAYWRKANHIHRWFVHNVQNGKDDCNEYYVSREQLQELVDVCKKVFTASTLVAGKITNGYRYENNKRIDIIEDGQVIADPSIARELLPTQAGFFFGSTDYDEYYLQAVKDTIDMLEPLLKEPNNDGFCYSSSW